MHVYQAHMQHGLAPATYLTGLWEVRGVRGTNLPQVLAYMRGEGGGGTNLPQILACMHAG